MAYNPHQDDKPVSSDNGLQVIDDIRHNDMALRDAAIIGVMPGWDFSIVVGAGSEEQPDRYLFTKDGSTERVRMTNTWGTTGGADGNLTKQVFEHSSDNGSNWDPLADTNGYYVLTLTYNSSGACISFDWGSTP